MKNAGAVSLALALTLLLAPAERAWAGETEDASPGQIVRYANGMLTIQVSDAPVAHVLADVGRQAGATIRGGVPPERRISVAFTGATLEEGLHRLLGDQSFALVYGAGDQLRAIRVMGGAAQEAYATTRAEAGAGRIQGMVLEDVIRTALSTEDADLRLAVLRRDLHRLEGEPAQQKALGDALQGADLERLLALLRASGARAPEVVMDVIAAAHTPAVRMAAANILRELRGGVSTEPVPGGDRT